MDGTLVDTEPVWVRVTRSVIGELGGHWTDDDALALVGSPLDRSLEAWFGAVPPGRIDRAGLSTRIFGGMQDALTAGVEFQPGVADLLGGLRAAGVPCALVSASFRSMIDAVLLHLPRGTFATTVAGDEVTRGKPDPEPYLTAARRLDADPAHCLVIEDSIGGAASGNAAGATVLVVASPGVDVPAAPRRIHRHDLLGLDVDRLAGLLAFDHEPG